MDKKITCHECGWNWKLSEGGNDPYVCHKCGNDNTKDYTTKIHISEEDFQYIKESIESGEVLAEDLGRWFKEKWVDVSRKIDGKHPPCGRKTADGEKGRKGYPKCRPLKKVSKETPKLASSYSKKEKKSMTAQKRNAEKKDPKPGKGNTPTFTRFDENVKPIKEAFDVSPNEYNKILQTKDFIMVVPFTHNASCKYGANTKWCTTKRNDDEDFLEHIESGLLVYVIVRNPEYREKLNSGKFAIYRHMFDDLNNGAVYTDLNNEHNLGWFKSLMIENGLEDDFEKIMETYNTYYRKKGYMGMSQTMNENNMITLDFDEIIDSYNPPRLTTLSESNVIISEGLNFHITKEKPLIENIYRIYSEKFFNLFNESRELMKKGLLEAYGEDYELLMTDIGKTGIYEGEEVYLDIPFVLNEEEYLVEAKHRGRNVKLNKPFRTPGGPKKFAVYVKNKSGNIVKVTFGDPNLKIRSNNRKAAKSFRARHKCDQKKDRTTAGYWSCNVSRYRKALGIKSSNPW
jgi:hypothetical protein